MATGTDGDGGGDGWPDAGGNQPCTEFGCPDARPTERCDQMDLVFVIDDSWFDGRGAGQPGRQLPRLHQRARSV
jgi:hypothetical protein